MDVNDIYPGMFIRTNPILEATDGMFARMDTLMNRKANEVGEVLKPVPGYGGDVWWVKHSGVGAEVIAPYCCTEFSARQWAEDEGE